MNLREPQTNKAAADAAVIAKIAVGDLENLGILFDRYEPDVRRVLVYLSPRIADVDDLVQITFLQVIPAASRYDPSFPARSWLAGIAAMMARRHRRSIMRMTARLGSWMNVVVREEPVTPDRAMDSRESTKLLEQALQQMSPKRREAFVLVAIEGISGQEAAASLGIPLNTLWTRLHHARLDLRARLSEDR
jgi:RNA polymerase sigma-70 factor (ECF subfamily)